MFIYSLNTNHINHRYHTVNVFQMSDEDPTRLKMLHSVFKLFNEKALCELLPTL